jgi:hypothetical protein
MYYSNLDSYMNNMLTWWHLFFICAQLAKTEKDATVKYEQLVSVEEIIHLSLIIHEFHKF